MGNPEQELVPPPCPSCGAEAKFRKECQACGGLVWVFEHLPEGASHYKWGLEVVPCKCSTHRTPENEKLRQRKVRKRQGKPPGIRHPPITTPEMARKAAEGMARGLSVRRAKLEAGFPEGSCRHGKKDVNKMIRAELKTLGRKYIEIGRDLSPEDQELVVRGMLFENVVMKTDKGVMAAKQLGADKRVAMWQADSQVGMVVLQAPAIPKLQHEVPWMESRFQKERDMRLKSQEEEPEPDKDEESPEGQFEEEEPEADTEKK